MGRMLPIWNLVLDRGLSGTAPLMEDLIGIRIRTSSLHQGCAAGTGLHSRSRSKIVEPPQRRCIDADQFQAFAGRNEASMAA